MIRGLNCPRCELRLNSVSGQSPLYQDGIVFRMKRCENGHTYWTHETVLMEKGDEPALTGDDIVELLRSERGVR